MVQQPASIRPSAIAGHWYPGEPDVLRSQINEYLHSAKVLEPAHPPLALVVPHAGYLYSGRCAASAFKQVAGHAFERVVVASPFHAPAMDALLTTEYQAYSTPLGEIPVDAEVINTINKLMQASDCPGLRPIRREQEHSLEIELPFLQTVLSKPFLLVPIMVRSHSPHILQTLGKALAHIAQQKSTLLVASTDLSHFYPAEMASNLDHAVLHHIEQLDPDALLRGDDNGSAQACGAGALAAILWAVKALANAETRIIQYTHSGHVTGDQHSVVGYGAAAIYAKQD